MKKILAMLLTSFLLFSSCAITSSDDRSVDRLPGWITETNLSQTTIEYIITSNGSDESDAYENACISFVDAFLNYLFITDKGDEYKKSLIKTLAIDDYEIYNTARYFENSESGVKGYFLFVADKEIINAKLKVQLLNNESATIAIQKLLVDVDNYYRSNKDYKAFNSMIDAYIISRENNISDDNIGFDNLLNRCILILNKTKIEVSNFESEQLSCSIEVTRQVGFFPPNVLGPKLKISYSSYNPEMKTYLETEKIDFSAKMNTYKFVPSNKTVYTDGVLLLEIDIDKALYKLEKQGYVDALKKLEKANKCYLLSYKTLSEFEGKNIRLSVYENDLNEIPISLIDVSNIVDVLQSLGAIVTVDELKKEFIDDSNIDSSIYDYHITFKNEVTEKLDEFKYIVKTAGSIEVANLAKKSVVFSSEPFETIANGETPEEALKSTFQNFALKGIFLLKKNF